MLESVGFSCAIRRDVFRKHGQGGVVQEGEAHQCQPYSLHLCGLSCLRPVPAPWADMAREVVQHSCAQARHKSRHELCSLMAKISLGSMFPMVPLAEDVEDV